MPEYSFTVVAHDTDRPWIVVGQERQTVALADDADFFEWAHERFPSPRWTVQLDPWQLGPEGSPPGPPR